jgi:hypothetical protein
MAYVYQHIRLDTDEPFYVGIGSDNIYKRANEKSRRNSIWNKIVTKAGYRTVILFDNITWEQACVLEIELIKSSGRINLNTGSLCNLTDGGEGTLGIIKTVSDDTRRRMSESAKGNKNMLGRKFSDEHKRKLSESHKGLKVSEETKIKIGVASKGNKYRLGYKMTEEHKNAIHSAWRGRKHSEESIRKIKEKRGIKIIEINTQKIYHSITDLAKELSISTFQVRYNMGKDKFGLKNYKYITNH